MWFAVYFRVFSQGMNCKTELNVFAAANPCFFRGNPWLTSARLAFVFIWFLPRFAWVFSAGLLANYVYKNSNYWEAVPF